MFLFNRGFTLIELLVVMLLMAISLSIVMPLSIAQVDSARARAERQKVLIAIERTEAIAFFTASAQKLVFQGKDIKYPANTTSIALNYLTFEPAELLIQPDGSVNNTNLTAYINEKKWVLQLNNETAEWLNTD